MRLEHSGEWGDVADGPEQGLVRGIWAELESSDLNSEGISGSDTLRGGHCSNPGGGWGSDHGQPVEAKGSRSRDVQRKCIGLESPWDTGTEKQKLAGPRSLLG